MTASVNAILRLSSSAGSHCVYVALCIWLCQEAPHILHQLFTMRSTSTSLFHSRSTHFTLRPKDSFSIRAVPYNPRRSIGAVNNSEDTRNVI
jgi:hypothetical protein